MKHTYDLKTNFSFIISYFSEHEEHPPLHLCSNSLERQRIQSSASQRGRHSQLCFSAPGEEPIILHSESKVSERNLSMQYIPEAKPTVSSLADIVESNAEDTNGP